MLEFIDNIKREQGTFTEKQFKDAMEGAKVNDNDVNGAKSSLYVALLTSTKGATKEMVKKNKTKDSFESYRYIITKGKNATALNDIVG